MTVLAIGGLLHDFNASAYDPRSGRVAMEEEERYSRKKHHSVWRESSTSLGCVDHVLREVGATYDDASELVFSDLIEHPIKKFLASKFPNAGVAAST